MVVPVKPVLPDSTLSPHQVNQKFHSSAMAGLGTCDWVDEDLICTPDTTGGYDPGLFAENQAGAPAYVLGTYMDDENSIVVQMSDGSNYTLRANGSYGPDATGPVAHPVSSAPRSVTSQQSNAWPAMIQSLVNAGVRIGTVANLPAGASLLPNGTIVGSGQSLIRPGVITSNTLTSALSTLTSSPMLMIGGFGLLAILLLSGGRR